jgi:hypothetical protein
MYPDRCTYTASRVSGLPLWLWEIGGRIRAILAVQVCTKVLHAPFCCQHPGTIRERRLMTHMLPMAASQVSHPIAMLILMKTNNRLLHNCTSLVYIIV